MSASANLTARVSPDFKGDLSLAAEIEGVSLTEYIVRNLRPCIEKTLQRDQLLELNAEQSRKLAEALLSDAEPGDRLKKAAKSYQESELGHR